MTFFHGTDTYLPVGSILVPGVEIDQVRNYGRSNHVYMTTDHNNPEDDIAIREAYAWARTACMVTEDENEDEIEAFAFVYIVEPLGDVVADGGEDVGEEAVRTSSARIIGCVSEDVLVDYVPGFGKSYLYFY
jgi:hypothetical protein